MDFLDLVGVRHSIRKFERKEVGDDTLTRILEAANSAPSAGDLQAYEIVVVKNPDKKRALARAAYGQNFIYEAPLSLVFLANPKRSWTKYKNRGADLYCIQDATIAAAYAQLAVHALGLGSVWVGAFDDNAVRRVVGGSEDLRPVAVIPVGYPAERPYATSRRKLEELVHFDGI